MREETYLCVVFIIYCFLIQHHHCEKYIVNSQKVEEGCRKTKVEVICSSLDSLFNWSKVKLNNAHITIENTDDKLNAAYPIKSVSTLHIIATSNVTVTCNSNNSAGLLFDRASNIHLGDDTGHITFQHCGMKAMVEMDGAKTEIESTLFFIDINNLWVKNIHCFRFNGYGIVLENVAGGNFEHIKLSENTASIFGGGLLFLYQKLNQELSKKYLNFIDLKFNQLQACNKSNCNSKPYKPFGNGGAISMYFNHNSTNHTLTFNDTVLSHNSGQLGGSIYIYDNTEVNTFIFNTLIIHDSAAFIYGGGVFYFASSAVSTSKEIDIFHCNSCNFTNCSASVAGGALGIFRSNLKTLQNRRFLITNSNFYMNSGNGSDLFISKVSLELALTNNFSGLHISKIGKVAMERSHLKISGSTTISNSTSSGIVGEHSILYIYGTLNLLSNKGKNGGGLALYGPSSIYLGKGCTFNVKDNFSQMKGGGIYAKIATSEYLKKCNCLFQFEGEHDSFNGTVIFDRNSENDIFVSSVHNCPSAGSEKPIVGWRNFKFTSSHPIATDPIDIRLDSNDWSRLMYPGIYFNISIELFDEFQNPTSGTVVITDNGQEEKKLLFDRSNYYISPGNQSVALNIKGEVEKPYKISFAISAIHSTTITLKLNHCPYLLILAHDNDCICPYSNKRKEKGSVVCQDKKIFLLENLWTPEILPNANYKHQEVFPCPDKYCKKCSTAECEYLPHHQCAHGRDQSSRLCSQCDQRRSLAIRGNEVCVPCTGSHFNPFLSGILAVGSMFCIRLLSTLIIVVLNREALAGFIVPFLYFYIFIPDILVNVKDWGNPNDPNKALKYLADIILQLRYFPLTVLPDCFVNGLNDMTMQFLYFFASITWPVSLYMCYVLLHKKLSWVSRETCKRSIIGIGFVLYAELLEFVIRALKGVTIQKKMYVYYYAAEEYCPKSWPRGFWLFFAILSMISIVYFFIAILLTTTWSAVKIIELNGKDDASEKIRNFIQELYKWIQAKANCWIFLWCKPVLISVQYGFKTNGKIDYTWFSLFYILFVTCFKTLALTVNKVSIKATLLTACVLVFFLLYVSIFPYNNSFSNVFESCVLVLLIFAGILTESNNGTYIIYQKECKAIIVSICLMPVFLVVVRLLVYCVSECIGKSISCLQPTATDGKFRDPFTYFRECF